MCVTSYAKVLFIQETWGSVKKLDRRHIDGFWHRSPDHCDVGKGLEVWVLSSWAQFKTVLLDTDHSFLVVVHNAWGLGVLGSVHMAQRSDELLYNQQLVHLIFGLQQLPASWLIVGVTGIGTSAHINCQLPFLSFWVPELRSCRGGFIFPRTFAL